jgi:hypothetical protein
MLNPAKTLVKQVIDLGRIAKPQLHKTSRKHNRTSLRMVQLGSGMTNIMNNQQSPIWNQMILV